MLKFFSYQLPLFISFTLREKDFSFLFGYAKLMVVVAETILDLVWENCSKIAKSN